MTANIGRKSLRQLLEDVSIGKITPDLAMETWRKIECDELSDYAKLDGDRKLRTGVPEVVYAEGKRSEHVESILLRMLEKTGQAIATRVTDAQFAAFGVEIQKHFTYYETARIVASNSMNTRDDAVDPNVTGNIAVLCAGTSDLPVAEEAAVISELSHYNVHRLYDVGVAGIHRLLRNRQVIDQAQVVICVAGMDGALPGVVGGLTTSPVIAVPTSIGYGASFSGVAPLLTMLNACSPGVGVVNIDNGFGAAVLASQIIQTASKISKSRLNQPKSQILTSNVRIARDSIAWWQRLWRTIRLFIARIMSGRNEIELICSRQGPESSIQLRSALFLSDKMTAIHDLMCQFKPFDENYVFKMLVEKENITLDESNDLLLEQNIKNCLQDFNFANKVYEKVVELRDESFNSENPQHEKLLEQLWESLKPGVRRTGGRITKEWTEIGFQGQDPKTDFRSMGVLSLHQLLHFASQHSTDAQQALEDSNHPVRWYPFSVVGISISSFLHDLMKQRLLDHLLYGNSSETTDHGLAALNEFYSTVFTRFNAFWVKSKPRDAMAFPTVFKPFTQKIREEVVKQTFRF